MGFGATRNKESAHLLHLGGARNENDELADLGKNPELTAVFAVFTGKTWTVD